MPRGFDKERCRRLRADGWPVKKIAAVLNVHQDTVVRNCVGVPTKRRFCDRAEARKLKVEGWLLTDIASRQGVSLTTISRACKDVQAPIRHSFSDKNKAAFHAERIRQRSQMQANRERARNWLERGYSRAAIARALELRPETICKYCKGVTRGRLIHGDVPDELVGKPEVLMPVQVPAWAIKAGLGIDYRDLAQALGEDYAARECRRLKAEAAR